MAVIKEKNLSSDYIVVQEVKSSSGSCFELALCKFSALCMENVERLEEEWKRNEWMKIDGWMDVWMDAWMDV